MWMDPVYPKFANRLAAGELPRSAHQLVCSARLFALGKEMTGKLLLQKYAEKARSIFTPLQLGIALPGSNGNL